MDIQSHRLTRQQQSMQMDKPVQRREVRQAVFEEKGLTSKDTFKAEVSPERQKKATVSICSS